MTVLKQDSKEAKSVWLINMFAQQLRQLQEIIQSASAEQRESLQEKAARSIKAEVEQVERGAYGDVDGRLVQLFRCIIDGKAPNDRTMLRPYNALKKYDTVFKR